MKVENLSLVMFGWVLVTAIWITAFDVVEVLYGFPAALLVAILYLVAAVALMKRVNSSISKERETA